MAEPPKLPLLQWENLNSSSSALSLSRARVPGGWFVWAHHEDVSLVFYPDPMHQWDGGSLADTSEESVIRRWIQQNDRWKEIHQQLISAESDLEQCLKTLPKAVSQPGDRAYRQAARNLKELQTQVGSCRVELAKLEEELKEFWNR